MTREEKKEELIGLFCTGTMYISELIEECFDFASPKWISFEDKLPPKDGRYLFYDTFLGPRVSAYYVECTLVKEITHWMPLPQAPKKGGEK